MVVRLVLWKQYPLELLGAAVCSGVASPSSWLKTGRRVLIRGIAGEVESPRSVSFHTAHATNRCTLYRYTHAPPQCHDVNYILPSRIKSTDHSSHYYNVLRQSLSIIHIQVVSRIITTMHYRRSHSYLIKPKINWFSPLYDS